MNRKYMVSEGVQTKKIRIEETTDRINKMKITDINQFCLELIFIHLSLGDLINVSDANKYLRFATYMPFIRNYARKSIKIDRNGVKEYKSDMRHPLVLDKTIIIVNLKAIFQMMRTFGGNITEIKFDYFSWNNNNKFENYHHIMSYINEFSNESLKHLTLNTALGFEYLNKSFLNVEDVYIRDSLHLKEKCLSRLFPKLYRLTLHDTNYSVASEYFPNLYHLQTDSSSWSDSRMADYATILQMNPNIRSLKININDFCYLDCIKNHLQSIESLEISTMHPQAYDNQIYLQNVTKFKIHYILPKSPPPKIPFLFNKLKEFEISNVYSHSDVLLPFINENRMIEKITICEISLLRLMMTDKLQETLSFLKDFIYMNWIRDTKYLLPKYLFYLNFLESFSFLSPDTDDEIRASCANEWCVTRTSSHYKYLVTLKRI